MLNFPPGQEGVADMCSPTWDPAAGAATPPGQEVAADTCSPTWDPAARAAPPPGQEVVACSSTAALDVDADDVDAVWRDAGGVVGDVDEQHLKCGCT